LYETILKILSEQIAGKLGDNENDDYSSEDENQTPESRIRSEAFKVLEVIHRRGRPRATKRSFFRHKAIEAITAPVTLPETLVDNSMPTTSASVASSITLTQISARSAPPQAPVNKKSGRRRLADYSELIAWEQKKQAKKASKLV
jgi:hypothetical protein